MEVIYITNPCRHQTLSTYLRYKMWFINVHPPPKYSILNQWERGIDLTAKDWGSD